MATFKFGRYIDIHWNGYDIQGPADTVFSIPDQLYEEFDADIAPVEPTLQWIDTNEFQTLQNSVPVYSVAATAPIAIASSTDTAGAVTKTWSLNANYSTSTHDHSGTYQPVGTYVNAVVGSSPTTVSTASGTATVSISSGTNPNGYLLTADGAGGVIFTPASTSGLTSVVGVSPISSIISGGTVSVSLTANYQTAGTYASSVSATSPISATLSTAGLLSLSIDSTLTSADSATRTRSLVRNTTVSTIAKGSFVYIDGSNGTVPTIQKALANADATSARTFGIVEADISSNSNGYVTNQGLITGIDTSGFADGAILWLSPTIAGAATTTKPTGPNHGVLLGIVVKGGSVGAGEIYIFIKNGAELDEIHDVNISGLQSGDTLIWSSTASVWQNQTLANAGIAASVHTHPYQASGTYVNAVIGTSPASVSTASGTATVSIVSSSINSTHLANNAVVAAKINAGAVDTSKISSGVAALNTVLTSDGAGLASFLPISGAVSISEFTASGTWTKPSGSTVAYVIAIGGGGGGSAGGLDTRGGNGALHVARFFKMADLGSTETVTIGAGGNGGVAGGSGATAGSSTTFGSKITATGGEKGTNSSTNATRTVGRMTVQVGGTAATTTQDGIGAYASTSTAVAADPSFYGTAGGGASSTNATGNGGTGGGGFGAPSGGAGATYVAQATGVAGSAATTIGSGGGGGAGGTTTGGTGGAGYLGGGGGTGGRGVTTNGAGGAGGSGYCLVISW